MANPYTQDMLNDLQRLLRTWDLYTLQGLAAPPDDRDVFMALEPVKGTDYKSDAQYVFNRIMRAIKALDKRID